MYGIENLRWLLLLFSSLSTHPLLVHPQLLAAVGESQPLRRPQSAAATVPASPLAIRAAASVAARTGSGIVSAVAASVPSGANGLMSPHRSRPVSANSNIGRGAGAGSSHPGAGAAHAQLSPQRMRDAPSAAGGVGRGGDRGGAMPAAAARGCMVSPLRGEAALATGGVGHRSLVSPLHSPLSKMPARRVTAGGTPPAAAVAVAARRPDLAGSQQGGGGRAGGALPAAAPPPTAVAAAATGRADLAGSQQFFDELVRRELSVPHGAAGEVVGCAVWGAEQGLRMGSPSRHVKETRRRMPYHVLRLMADPIPNREPDSRFRHQGPVAVTPLCAPLRLSQV